MQSEEQKHMDILGIVGNCIAHTKWEFKWNRYPRKLLPPMLPRHNIDRDGGLPVLLGTVLAFLHLSGTRFRIGWTPKSSTLSCYRRRIGVSQVNGYKRSTMPSTLVHRSVRQDFFVSFRNKHANNMTFLGRRSFQVGFYM